MQLSFCDVPFLNCETSCTFSNGFNIIQVANIGDCYVATVMLAVYIYKCIRPPSSGFEMRSNISTAFDPALFKIYIISQLNQTYKCGA